MSGKYVSPCKTTTKTKKTAVVVVVVVIKLPISIRTFIGRPPELSPMPQCVWEGEGDLTAAGQKRRPSTGLTDREKLPPLGFGVAKALQTLGVATCFHGFPWEVAGC